MEIRGVYFVAREHRRTFFCASTFDLKFPTEPLFTTIDGYSLVHSTRRPSELFSCPCLSSRILRETL